MKKIVFVLGISNLIACTTLMYITFAVAYFNGKAVTVFIDRFKEANIELAMLLFLMPFTLLFVYNVLKKEKES